MEKLNNNFPVTLANNCAQKCVDLKRINEELKVSKSELAESYLDLDIIFNSVNTHIRYIKTDGTIVAVNNAYAEFVGLQKDEIVGKNLCDIMGADEFENCWNNMNNMQIFKEIEKAEEWRLNSKGERRLFRTIRTPKMDSNKRVQYIICSAEDVTDYIQIQNELKKREELFMNFMNSASEMFVFMDADMNIVEVNTEVERMYGISKDIIIGRNLHEISPETWESGRYKSYFKVIETGEPLEIEDVLASNIFGSMNISLKAFKVGEGLGIIIRDISGQKKIEEELRNAKQLAESASASKSLFLANMSHEIRTPLHAIIGMTHFLEHTGLNREQLQYLEALTDSATSLKGIINDILDISKIESGKLMVDKIPFNLCKLVTKSCNSLSLLAEEKRLNFIYNVDKQISDNLIGDPVRIQQVLTNLVNNAIKFTERGEVKVECRLEAKNESYQTILFKVSDTGIGIDEQNIHSVFESFNQEDGSITRKFGGTGLGLSISRQLVELMDGKIGVSSRKWNGSQFWFKIRLMIGEENCEPLPEEVNIVKKGLSNIRILYVEDHEINQFLVSSMLKRWNADYAVAENGEVAVEMMKTRVFDLILMDKQMPVMDGLEASRIIRNELKISVPIIALTADVIKGVVDDCYAAGMNDYIAKPFSADELYHKIESNLRKTNSEDVGNHQSNESLLYDIQGLHKMFEFNKEQVLKILDMFTKLAPESIRELNNAYLANDFSGVSRVAHKMKASANVINSQELLSEIKAVESHAERKAKGAIKQHLDNVNLLMEKIVSKMKADIEELF